MEFSLKTNKPPPKRKNLSAFEKAEDCLQVVRPGAVSKPKVVEASLEDVKFCKACKKVFANQEHLKSHLQIKHSYSQE